MKIVLTDAGFRKDIWKADLGAIIRNVSGDLVSTLYVKLQVLVLAINYAMKRN